LFFQLKPFCLFVLVQRELDKLVTTVDKLVSSQWTLIHIALSVENSYDKLCLKMMKLLKYFLNFSLKGV